MNSVEELINFSSRLKWSLKNALITDCNAAQLAVEFNCRANGRKVTTHAAQNWLSGVSIPTQDKIHVLAKWLKVRAEWLRYGSGPEPVPNKEASLRQSVFDDDWFLENLSFLDQHHRILVQEFVTILLRIKPDT